MIKGHDSREQESAVRGACNLVSLFFLETLGQPGGQATDDGHDGIERLLSCSPMIALVAVIRFGNHGKKLTMMT